MSSVAIIRDIGGDQYRQYAILNPGENLYFTSGGRIAVETYGEVNPQVYQSKLTNKALGWAIHFAQHRLVAAQGTIGSLKNAITRNKNAVAVAESSSKLQNIATGSEYLMIYIPVAEYRTTRLYRNGFGTKDVIGTDSSWLTRVLGS